MGKVVGEIVAFQEHVSLILYSPEELGQGCVDMFRCFVLIPRVICCSGRLGTRQGSGFGPPI